MLKLSISLNINTILNLKYSSWGTKEIKKQITLMILKEI